MPTGHYKRIIGINCGFDKGEKRQPLSETHRKNISKGVKKHLPSTTFKKGFTPHNKGKKGCTNKGSFKKGHISFSKGKRGKKA